MEPTIATEGDNAASVFERAEAALATGKFPRTAARYAVPGLVLDPATAIPRASDEEVEAAFRGAADANRQAAWLLPVRLSTPPEPSGSDESAWRRGWR